MNKSVIQYNLESCEHCLKCIKTCPSEAICRREHSVEIDEEKCIHCGKCIDVCEKKGLVVENAHISTTLDLYDYTVALIPTSFYSYFSSIEEAGKMLNAIKKLGFNEVVDYGDIEGAIYLESIYRAEDNDELNISSFCPCINELIQKQFPMLLDQMVNLQYPVEVAAKKCRERLEKQYGKVGIYSLCECVSKMRLAKVPFGNNESYIDYAMSLSHIFPKANSLKDDNTFKPDICREGICGVVSDFYHYYQHEKTVMGLSGIDSCIQALELAEFGHLDEIGLLGLFACQGGCVGGKYLWTNPLIGRIHLDQLSVYSNKEVLSIDKDDMDRTYEIIEKQNKSFKEKMNRFNKINEILASLPQYDCGACGYPNCRALAEAIYNEKADVNICRVKNESGE